MKAILAVLALLLPLVAFAADDPPDPAADAPDVSVAKHLVAELRARHYDAIEAMLAPALKTGDPRAVLSGMAGMLPPDAAKSIAVGADSVTVFQSLTGDHQRSRRVALELQFEFAERWLLADFQWHTVADGPVVIDGFRFRPLPAPLQTINRFTFQDKGITHDLMLASVIAAPLFSLAVLVVCLRTPMPRRRKILWSIAILFGVTMLRFNWTTGAVTFDPLYVQILSASMLRSNPLAPWVLSVSIPLAAILFLIKRASSRRTRTATGVAPETAAHETFSGQPG